MPSSPEPPFSYVYVLEEEGKPPRSYTELKFAKSQLTKLTSGGKHNITTRPIFTCSVRLWAVGERGWELLFSGESGSDARHIPWPTSVGLQAEASAKAEAGELELLSFDEEPT